jgi:ParB family chromosome partitioning protein
MTSNIAQTGTIEHVDPNVIVVEANVRTVATLDRHFVASIKQNGVLTPILARRDEQGNVIVRAGQLRTLAAREAGLATIPVYIVEADETTIDRIVQQMVENDHRAAVTDSDRVAAFQQLTFEGLTPAAIAKRTGSKATTVEAGIAVAGHNVAASAIVDHSLTLDQAATLIEFEGGDKTVADLIEVAVTDPAQFAHAAQRARDNIKRSTVKKATEAELAARGFEILDREFGYYETDYVGINNLVTKDGDRVTVDQIGITEGRAAFVRVYIGGESQVTYYVKNFKSAGFRKDSGAGSTSGPMTDKQKADRITLVANNKAWASAEVVRRTWLTEFLSRKTLPKDAGTVIAQGLTMHRREVGSAATNGNTLAHTLLGIERGGYWDADKLTALLDHSPTKSQHVALAVVLGGIEDSTSKETWRYPSVIKALYFEQLAAWGYGLSEVEQIAATTAATVTDAAAHDGAEREVEDTDIDTQ